ncbi:hypothetical protein HDV05_006785 [Chytridiales sp. JEL 0842]|nr:hypothetical protein HDV05_006785 [Chytridiales sp. JEL 0842]
MPTYKVAILVCDVPAQSVQDASGGAYPTLFQRLLDNAATLYNSSLPNAQTDGVKIASEAFDVMNNAYPDPSKFDALLLTGSRYSAYDDIPWIKSLKTYLQSAHETSKVKIIGVCFGHQILTEAFGGKVEKNKLGWEVGFTEMRLTEAGKRIYGDQKLKVSLHSMHQDHVTVPPKGFLVLMETDICPVQAMIKGDRICTVQGHPEFSDATVRELVRLRSESGIFSKEFSKGVTDLLDQNLRTDGVWFASLLVRFLHVGL